MPLRDFGYPSTAHRVKVVPVRRLGVMLQLELQVCSRFQMARIPLNSQLPSFTTPHTRSRTVAQHGFRLEVRRPHVRHSLPICQQFMALTDAATTDTWRLPQELSEDPLKKDPGSRPREEERWI